MWSTSLGLTLRGYFKVTKDQIQDEIMSQIFELKHNCSSYGRQMILYIDKGSLNEFTKDIPLLSDGTVKSNQLLGLKYYLVESMKPHINVTYKD